MSKKDEIYVCNFSKVPNFGKVLFEEAIGLAEQIQLNLEELGL